MLPAFKSLNIYSNINGCRIWSAENAYMPQHSSCSANTLLKHSKRLVAFQTQEDEAQGTPEGIATNKEVTLGPFSDCLNTNNTFLETFCSFLK